jgi:NhaP-type Na+/H+ or K+/H+ antiporter
MTLKGGLMITDQPVMVPVFVTLARLNLRADEKLFMGWFGPRGLASIVFAVIVLNKHLPGGDTISMTVVCTIILSIILHGLSANPLVNVLRSSALDSGRSFNRNETTAR